MADSEWIATERVTWTATSKNVFLLTTGYCLLSTSFLLDGFRAFADDRLLFTGGAENAQRTGFAKRCWPALVFAAGCGSRVHLSMNFIKRGLFELQETTLLAARAAAGVFRRPRYIPETIVQMDAIGVGSLTIILLTGFFTGAVLTLQTYPTLQFYGAQSKTGYLVAISLIRELGPVLTALMVTGRVGSSISAELGSMKVSEQIDAMRALGTDPVRKLVAPRLIGLLVTMPLLTVIADVVGIGGGGVVSNALYAMPFDVFLTSVRDGITTDDIIGGVVKPICFALIIGTIACYKGLSTTGGTVGVGRSTTQAVVTASIVVIIADFFIARGLQFILGMPTG
jgi:phospholipid/cholesterol/gamma-HCH transport system permease protein